MLVITPVSATCRIRVSDMTRSAVGGVFHHQHIDSQSHFVGDDVKRQDSSSNYIGNFYFALQSLSGIVRYYVIEALSGPDTGLT